MVENVVPQPWPAPKDGRAVRAMFHRAPLETTRWVASAQEWKVKLDNGHWHSMAYVRGGTPLGWYPGPL